MVQVKSPHLVTKSVKSEVLCVSVVVRESLKRDTGGTDCNKMQDLMCGCLCGTSVSKFLAWISCLVLTRISKCL